MTSSFLNVGGKLSWWATEKIHAINHGVSGYGRDDAKGNFQEVAAGWRRVRVSLDFTPYLGCLMVTKRFFFTHIELERLLALDSRRWLRWCENFLRHTQRIGRDGQNSCEITEILLSVDVFALNGEPVVALRLLDGLQK
jgi:hypothetical protein